MTSASQLGAYPSLIPGSMECGVPGKPWDVIELESDSAHKAGGEGPSTSKSMRIVKLPKVVLRHDHWIRYHELTHVERPDWERSKNQLRELMRTMLEEVALDGQCLHRDGIDLRQARDYFDWAKRTRPSDVYRAAAMYFQVWTSAQISQDKALQQFHQDTIDRLTEEERANSALDGLAETLTQAAEAVFTDYSSGNCEDWADIVTAKLLGVKKEDLPDAPDPVTKPGTGTGTGTPAPGGSATEAGEPEPGGATSDPGVAGNGDDPGDDADDAGDDQDDPGGSVCPTCEGQGVDDDGDECPECGGDGAAPPASPGVPGGDDHEPGDEQGGEEPGHPEGGPQDTAGDGLSAWDDAPVPIDKDRQNEPSDFSFDPLGKSVMDFNKEAHDMPPDKNWKQREVLTREAVQEEIDRDRAMRKLGEASQTPELTARTPHGAVDVHRHTLVKGTSTSVALGWRSSEMGATVRYPSQLYPSGRVFAKRAPGGSIILDGSGSMAWHTQHIVQAQQRMPNLYVAVYSYHGGNGYWFAAHGGGAQDIFIARYCILAQKGQLDPNGITSRDAEPEHTGDNAGSDPASLWYASRHAPAPFVWVSDGMVSFGEEQHFYRQCDALMRQHKIVRVLTIEDAIDYLMGKAVPGWHQCATVDVKWVRLGQAHQGRSIDPGETYREARRWSQLRASHRSA